jgi:hypothetical protein
MREHNYVLSFILIFKGGLSMIKNLFSTRNLLKEETSSNTYDNKVYSHDYFNEALNFMLKENRYMTGTKLQGYMEAGLEDGTVNESVMQSVTKSNITDSLKRASVFVKESYDNFLASSTKRNDMGLYEKYKINEAVGSYYVLKPDIDSSSNISEIRESYSDYLNEYFYSMTNKEILQVVRESKDKLVLSLTKATYNESTNIDGFNVYESVDNVATLYSNVLSHITTMFECAESALIRNNNKALSIQVESVDESYIEEGFFKNNIAGEKVATGTLALVDTFANSELEVKYINKQINKLEKNITEAEKELKAYRSLPKVEREQSAAAMNKMKNIVKALVMVGSIATGVGFAAMDAGDVIDSYAVIYNSQKNIREARRVLSFLKKRKSKLEKEIAKEKVKKGLLSRFNKGGK